MAENTARRAGITLYSDPNDLHSHRCRLVIAEKGVSVTLVEASLRRPTEALLALNPAHAVPTLVERDIILYHSRIVMEYLDERYPHPALMPPYPAGRAEVRLILHRVDNDWYRLVENLEKGGRRAAELRKELTDSLTGFAPFFRDRLYFLGDNYSLIDCALAPLLWRLPGWGVVLPEMALPLQAYAKRLFSRAAFAASLSRIEQKMQLIPEK